MASITLKQGDTTPEFTAILENPAQELTGDETIRFYMEAPTDQNQQQGDLIVNAEIPDSQVDYTSNEVTYDFSAGETSRLDDHLAEFVVTYADGEIQTFPQAQYHTITIEEPVNRDVPPEDLDPQDITVGVVDADQVNAPTLQAVETLTGSLTGGQTLSDIAGPNLSIQNGELTAGDVQESANHFNTTYDSDEDGTIDADVDNDLVDTRELSVSHNDEPAITRQVVFKAEDTDTTTPLSFDTGALDTHQEFRVRATVGGHGDTSPLEFRGQVNNISDGQYDSVRIGGGAVETITDATYWADELWRSQQATIDWSIRGPSPNAIASIGPSVSGNSSGIVDNNYIRNGQVSTSGELPVESIQLFTAQNAVATVVVEGIDF